MVVIYYFTSSTIFFIGVYSQYVVMDTYDNFSPEKLQKYIINFSKVPKNVSEKKTLNTI